MTLLHEHRPMRIHVEHGDQSYELRTLMVFVSNNRLQLERIGLPEAAALEHGQLVATVLKPVDALTLLRLMLRGALGQLGDADHIASFAFRQITVMPARALLYDRRRIKVAMDGEAALLKAPPAVENGFQYMSSNSVEFSSQTISMCNTINMIVGS